MEQGSTALDSIVEELSRLRAMDARLELFGADQHRYELGSVLSEDAIVRFERDHEVVLPAEYRQFLARVGNGGAGPDYGLSPLAAWQPELILVSKVVEFADGKPLIVDGKPVVVDIGPRPHTDRPAIPSRPFAIDGPWPTREEDRLPAPGAHPFDGCTHLAEMGDGYRSFLVITGSRAGEVWEDHTHGVAYEAVRPTGDTFFEWYRRWLDSAIESLAND